MKNKKIKNATASEYNNIKFKSKLELTVYKTLVQAGFNPEYENKHYTLWEGFKPIIPFFTKDKNKKLKHSKMFIDLDSYRKICEKYGTTLTEHLERIERYQNKDDATPDMQDISIMYDVYMYITKVIRPRR